MAHIHIALVGGQPAPIIEVINHLAPDFVILIVSDTSAQHVPFIREKAAGPQYVVKQLLPFDVVDVRKGFEEVLDLCRGVGEHNAFSVDITSGTKVWSHMIFKILGPEPGVVFYNLERTHQLTNLTDETVEETEGEIVLFAEPVEFTPIEDYDEADRAAAADIEAMRRMNYVAFNQMFGNSKIPLLTCGNCTLTKMDGGGFDVHFENKKGEHVVDYIFDSPKAADLLYNYGWFEFKVASLIAQWPEAKNVKLNNQYRTENGQKYANEVDITFEARGRMVFVECKTQVFNSTDVDKFNSVVDRIGKRGALKLFVTEVPMEITAADKCDEYGILRYSLQKGNGKSEPAEQLFALLTELVESQDA